jgi:hypothetical protein
MSILLLQRQHFLLHFSDVDDDGKQRRNDLLSCHGASTDAQKTTPRCIFQCLLSEGFPLAPITIYQNFMDEWTHDNDDDDTRQFMGN